MHYPTTAESHPQWYDNYHQHQPLLRPFSSDNKMTSDIDSKLDKLENGIVNNLYVDSTCRRVTGACVLLICIVGFVLMGVNAASGGICPASLSLMLCFGCYGVLAIGFILGTFIACGFLGMLATCECCGVCAQCGSLFALCSIISE